jgi:ribosomal protein S18 acetylase RimI-like enzyme
MADWIIRPAELKDAIALSKCIDAAYSIYALRLTDLPAVSEGVAGDIENQLVWVAELKQSIIGGLILIPSDMFMLLANIAVDPRFSGMGLGRELMELAESESRRLGLGELRLSTHVNMPENIDLYSHFGWQEAGRSGNKVHMAKILNPGVG